MGMTGSGNVPERRGVVASRRSGPQAVLIGFGELAMVYTRSENALVRSPHDDRDEPLRYFLDRQAALQQERRGGSEAKPGPAAIKE
jgi:hypothetical protein